ncbi:nitroreductase [Catenovulum agarivorans DS-2]|uniref:Nitroreductase n=2 Tax=Catenovulum agarivorans TaxID=1172192 RepID=W7QBN5_9ALTE|nr:nitroreductase [Catenovulum agarivorans DS-2]
MEIISALNWRYAVREFSEQTIESATIDKLAEATRLSASSYGLQPYRLIILRDTATRQQLLQHAYGQTKVRDSSHLFILAIQTQINEAFIDNHFNMVENQRGLQAGALAGFSNHVKEAMLPMSQLELSQWAENQAHIALGNLLTVAAIEQVDACPMAGFNKAGFDHVLGLKHKGLSSSVICALGVRSSSDASAKYVKTRVPQNQFCIRL